jgi:hypothetical protein
MPRYGSNSTVSPSPHQTPLARRGEACPRPSAVVRAHSAFDLSVPPLARP